MLSLPGSSDVTGRFFAQNRLYSESMEKPEPTILPEEDISEIPASLRKDLNILPAGKSSSLPPEIAAQVRALNGEAAGEEPGGFSWAGLIYGPVYYAAMKDWSFAVISLLASIFFYTIPLLIPLAFFARKRAWQYRDWEGEEQFWQAQRQWDKSALVIGIVLVISLYVVAHYIIGTLSATFGTTDPQAILQQVQDQYKEIQY
jgi:hypothetical protein